MLALHCEVRLVECLVYILREATCVPISNGHSDLRLHAASYLRWGPLGQSR